MFLFYDTILTFSVINKGKMLSTSGVEESNYISENLKFDVFKRNLVNSVKVEV